MVRVSFTVPPQVREDLGYLSGRLGVTKSSFVSLLLGQAVADLRKLMEAVPGGSGRAGHVAARKIRQPSEVAISGKPL